MKTLIIGLLLACVSGVTVVAFRHPIGFAKLFPYFLAAVTALFTGFSIWHVAIEFAWATASNYIAVESLQEASDAKTLLGPAYIWVAIWYVGAIAYLWIILKLPPFLQATEENATSIDNTNSH